MQSILRYVETEAIARRPAEGGGLRAWLWEHRHGGRGRRAGGRGSGQGSFMLVQRARSQSVGAQGGHVGEERLDLILQVVKLSGHLLELVRVLDAGGAAIRGVQALEVEMATSSAGVLSVALDLAPLAFVAGD